MKAQLIFQSEKSSKFWNISTSGKKITTTYGKTGTKGQSSVKDFKTAAEVAKHAEKLIQSKLKKGYVAAGASEEKSKSASSKPTKAKSTGTKKKQSKTQKQSRSKPTAKKLKAKVVAPLITLEEYGNMELTYQGGSSIFSFTLEGDEIDELREGTSFVEYLKLYQLHRYYDIQRQCFRSNADASAFLKSKLANAKLRRNVNVVNKLGFDAAIDLSKYSKPAKAQIPRFGEIAIAKSGPIDINVNGISPWIYPRPPFICAGCGQAMMPAYSFYGDIASSLGKNAGIYIFACPPGKVHCDRMHEVVVQRADRETQADQYFTDKPSNSFYNLHLSEQHCNSIVDAKVIYCVATHRGKLGTAGWVEWEKFAKLDAAKTFINKQIRVHVKGKYKPSKPTPAQTKLYQPLYDSMLGKGPKVKKLKAKRISGDYVAHLFEYSFSRLAANNIQLRPEEIGGEPIGLYRGIGPIKTIEKWTSPPFRFLTHVAYPTEHVLYNQAIPFTHDVWVDPDAEFGRIFAGDIA